MAHNDKPKKTYTRHLNNQILKPQLKKEPSEEAIEAAFQTALKADKEASNEPTNRLKDVTDEEFLEFLKTMFKQDR